MHLCSASIKNPEYSTHFEIGELCWLSYTHAHQNLVIRYLIRDTSIIWIEECNNLLDLPKAACLQLDIFDFGNNIKSMQLPVDFHFGCVFEFCIDCIFSWKKNLNYCKLYKSNLLVCLEWEYELVFWLLTLLESDRSSFE